MQFSLRMLDEYFSFRPKLVKAFVLVTFELLGNIGKIFYHVKFF